MDDIQGRGLTPQITYMVSDLRHYVMDDFHPGGLSFHHSLCGDSQDGTSGPMTYQMDD